MNKKYKVVNKKRFFCFLTTVFVVLYVIIQFAFLPTNIESKNSLEYITVVAKKGDTLWSVTQKNTANQNRDIRKSIYEISKINNIENNIIYEGQIIKIPVK